jgi:hypothetical protein
MSYKDQELNSDCSYCTCKCIERTSTKQCCLASCANHCEIYFTDYNDVDKMSNDCCSTCFCTLLCFGPKFVLTLPLWPFTIYNSLRNSCKKTSNVNYIC